MPIFKRWAVLLCAAVGLSSMLAACGGGASSGNAVLIASSTPVARMKALATSGVGGGVAASDAARQLLDFGEAQYPGYFPGHKSTLQSAPFVYRFYPETGIYLGVAVDVKPGDGYTEGGVYAMGGEFGSSPMFLGNTSKYIQPKDALGSMQPLSKWKEAIPREGAGGDFLAVVNGVLYSYGYGGKSGLMASTDEGSTWSRIDTPFQPHAVSFIQGRIVITGLWLKYAVSNNGAKSWTDGLELPSIPAQWEAVMRDKGYQASADCLVTLSEKLFLVSGDAYLGLPALPTWVTADGQNFRVASTDESIQLRDFFESNFGFSKCPYKGAVLPNLVKNQIIGDGDNSPPNKSASLYFKTSRTPGPDYPGVTNWFVSADKTNWRQISPFPSAWQPRFITEISKGKFVGIVRAYGSIADPFNSVLKTFVSTDGGEHWIDVGGGPTASRTFRDISATGSVVIAVADDGTIARSADDGATWSYLTTNVEELWGIATNGSIFVAAGKKGTVITSMDFGLTWTMRRLDVTDDFDKVIFNGGKFIAIARSGAVLSSADGSDWSPVGDGLRSFAPLGNSLKVAAGGGAILVASPPAPCIAGGCAVWNSGVFRSVDGGRSWTRVLGAMAGIAFGNDFFVASEFGNSSPTRTWTSADFGASWSLAGSCESCRYIEPYYSGGTFFSLSESGVRFSLNNGTSWEIYSMKEWSPDGVKFIYTGSRWIVVGVQNYISVAPH